MKSFQKLALASAVAMTSFGAFAMQAMDDESMSAATGQDGITMLIALPCYGAATCFTDSAHGVSIDEIFMKDVGGFSAADSTGTTQTYADTGYLRVAGLNLQTTAGTPIVVNIDQTGNSGNTTGTAAAAANTDTPTLNVAVSVPAISVNVGAVYVTNGSNTAAASYKETKIANAMTITTNGTTSLNIQLGGQPQGALVNVSTAITGGLTLSNVGVHDGVFGGDINTGSISIIDASGGTALTVKAAVNVVQSTTVIGSTSAPAAVTAAMAGATHGGLVLTLGQLGAAGLVGTAGGGIDVTLSNTTLGDLAGSAALGDVIIHGLNINGTKVLVFGH